MELREIFFFTSPEEVLRSAFIIAHSALVAIRKNDAMEIVREGGNLIFRSTETSSFSIEMNHLLEKRDSHYDCMCGKKHRLNISFENDALRDFKRLKELLRVSTDAEVARQSLAALDHIYNAVSNGYEIDLARDDRASQMVRITARTETGDRLLCTLPLSVSVFQNAA